jgi:hypothetical protein
MEIDALQRQSSGWDPASISQCVADAFSSHQFAMEKMGFAAPAADVSVRFRRSHLRSLQVITLQVMDGVFQMMAADGKEYIDYIRYEVAGQTAVLQSLSRSFVSSSFSRALEGVPDHLRASW